MNVKPEQYSPVTLGAAIDLGVGGNIRQLYTQFLDTSTPGKIIVDDTVREVEPEVVAMLKAILQAGCCRIEERAAACRKVFIQCVSANTREEFVNKFDRDDTDTFVQAIYKAVKEEWYS